MKLFSNFPDKLKKKIRFVLTDIDDTLTNDGRLPAAAFDAMDRLRQEKIIVIPITGRPAGWCDHFARMWPVDGVVGENGAFYFRYDDDTRKMTRRYFKTAQQRKTDKKKLERLAETILKAVPGCMISADQAYREADLAIDFCEDVPHLDDIQIKKIVDCFTNDGATAKISSIHVNGWFGDYDKLTMTRYIFDEVFSTDLERVKDQVIYTGDSPNDAPMFKYFPNSTGVANVMAFEDSIPHKPVWITKKEGGHGFAEMVDILLE